MSWPAPDPALRRIAVMHHKVQARWIGLSTTPDMTRTYVVFMWPDEVVRDVVLGELNMFGKL